jgi:hypothetical protein
MWTMFFMGVTVGVNIAGLILSFKESHDTNKKKTRMDLESE